MLSNYTFRVTEMKSCTLLVENLDSRVTEQEVDLFFSSYADIRELRLNRNKGLALVDMYSSAEAECVMNHLNGFHLWGRDLHIHEVHSLTRWKLPWLLR